VSLGSSVEARHAGIRLAMTDAASGRAAKRLGYSGLDEGWVLTWVAPGRFSLAGCSGKRGFDGGRYLGRIGLSSWLETGDGISVAVEEELGEVPLDFAAEFGVFGLAGEELVERGLVVAFDGKLRHHGERDVVFFRAEGLDFLVAAGLLAHEVVGGDSDDNQAAVFVFFVEGFEGGVLRGVSAVAGDIDQQQDLAVVFGERRCLPVDGLQREVIHRLFGSCKERRGDEAQNEAKKGGKVALAHGFLRIGNGLGNRDTNDEPTGR